jgi:hypothetical protein
MVVERVDGTELKFKNPGQLLLLVISFVFWGVGFLDLLGHTSADPKIFGLYSLPLFVFILLYASTGSIWILLFVNANLLSRVGDVVRFIQSKTILALSAFVAIGIAFWLIFEWDRWARMPALQFSIFGQVLLAALILMLANWNAGYGRQVWRKVIVYPLIALLILEAIIQLAAWLYVLPGIKTIGGHFYPYERVYYHGESTRNGFANRYGWYFPDITLDDDKKRILVVGGSPVQGLQVHPEQQFSAVLSERISQERIDTEGKLISIGMPGFGLSPFLYDDSLNELPSLLKIDEIVVFFHLGDDFQSPLQGENAIRYRINDQQEIEVHPDDARLRHDLTHYYLRAFMSFQLVETLRSNYLTPTVLLSPMLNQAEKTRTDGNIAQDEVDFPRLVGSVTGTYAVTEPGHAGIKTTGTQVIPNGNNFLFDIDARDDRQEAFIIAENMLREAQNIASANNVTVRVVTVPLFPESFFKSFQAKDWGSQFGTYDLFLPEKELIEIANRYEIPILPMGQYMLEDGLSVEEINALYLSLGQGAFTPEGHRYFADAIFTCFYSEKLEPLCQ